MEIQTNNNNTESEANNSNTESQIPMLSENKAGEKKHEVDKIKLYDDEQLLTMDSMLRFVRIFFHLHLITIVVITFYLFLRQ